MSNQKKRPQANHLQPACNHDFGEWVHKPQLIKGLPTGKQFWQRMCRKCGFMYTHVGY